jgi:hypothetical protein
MSDQHGAAPVAGETAQQPETTCETCGFEHLPGDANCPCGHGSPRAKATTIGVRHYLMNYLGGFSARYGFDTEWRRLNDRESPELYCALRRVLELEAAPPAPEPPAQGDPHPAEQLRRCTCVPDQTLACPIHDLMPHPAERAPEGGEPQWGAEARYEDDDTAGYAFAMMQGGNGDFYVGVGAADDRRISKPVRITTSGQRREGVVPALGALYRALLGRAGEAAAADVHLLAPPAPSVQDAEDEALIYAADLLDALAGLPLPSWFGFPVETLPKGGDFTGRDLHATAARLRAARGAGQAPAEPGATCEPGRKFSRPWCCTHDAPLVCQRAAPAGEQGEALARELERQAHGLWHAQEAEPEGSEVYRATSREIEALLAGAATLRAPAPAPAEGALREALWRLCTAAAAAMNYIGVSYNDSDEYHERKMAAKDEAIAAVAAAHAALTPEAGEASDGR